MLAEAQQALTLFEEMPTRDRSYGAEMHTRIDQALAHLLLSDLDGADAALRPVLTLAPENRYEPITQHLGQVREALSRPEFRDAALAQQLQEEVETYNRESIVNDLPGWPRRMGAAGHRRHEAALAAACVKNGLEVKDATVTYARSNTVYRLGHDPVVVRLRYAPGSAEPGTVSQVRQAQAAAHRPGTR